MSDTRLASLVLALLGSALPGCATVPKGMLAEHKPEYTSTTPLRFAPRTTPAKITAEDGSALRKAGYVKVGTIHFGQPGNHVPLESAMLEEAARNGGDVVHLDREGVRGSIPMPTGKTRKRCTNGDSTTVGTLNPVTTKHCTIQMIGGYQNRTCWDDTSWQMGTRTNARCLDWTEIPEIRETESRISEGSVWRYDPEFAAKTTQSEEAKATVYVYRARSIWGAIMKPVVYCDDVALAHTQNGRYFRLTIDPGYHLFRGEQQVDNIAEIIKPGGVYYFMASVVQGGFAEMEAEKYFLGPRNENWAKQFVKGPHAGERGAVDDELKALDPDEVIDRERVAAKGQIPDSPRDLALAH
jgi:hypothetical protein